MDRKKVVLPLVAIAVVLLIIVAGKMLAGGFQGSNVESVEREKGVEKPADAAKEKDAIGQKVSHAEKSPMGRSGETKTIDEVLRAHVLPGVAMVYRVVRYDEEALKEDILSTFPDVEDVRVDEDIVYIKYKDGTVDIYETGFEDKSEEGS